MALNIATCLKLAEHARNDTSLLPNHLGTVDRMLCDKRDEDNYLLSLIDGDSEQQAMANELREEVTAIEHALTAYAS